jgi:hypothetical protein
MENSAHRTEASSGTRACRLLSTPFWNHRANVAGTSLRRPRSHVLTSVKGGQGRWCSQARDGTDKTVSSIDRALQSEQVVISRVMVPPSAERAQRVARDYRCGDTDSVVCGLRRACQKAQIVYLVTDGNGVPANVYALGVVRDDARVCTRESGDGHGWVVCGSRVRDGLLMLQAAVFMSMREPATQVRHTITVCAWPRWPRAPQ